ncbi:MAG: PAS domain S-box protein [Thermodesulfovibrionales bacterium]|nr:PAS domain S-box protein [Thermodesulfovibrionales bacterium]
MGMEPVAKMKSRIQIVEDELIVASDIKSCLLSLGYFVTCISATGEDAVEHAARHKPNLVLMDIKLKGEMDGISAAGLIREQSRIPVVYLTGNMDVGLLERAKRTEPFGYLVKPFEEHELMSTIETAMYRHRMELRLLESEQRFRRLVENAADAIYVCDRDGDMVDVNVAACDALGYSCQELLGMKVSDINPEMTQERIEELIEQAMDQESPITLSGRHTRGDGATFPIEVRITTFISEGKPLLLALARDVSEHKRLVSELRESIRRVNTLKSIVPLCVLKKNLTSAEEIEEGIRAHHSTVLTSGVCPDCLSAFKRDISTGMKGKKPEGKPYSPSGSEAQDPSHPQPPPRDLSKDSRPSR